MQPNNGQKLPPNKWKFLGFFQASEASPLSSPTFWQVSEARCISLSAKGNTQYLKTQPTESRTRHWNFMQSRCPGFSCVFTDATRNWLPAVRGTTALLPWHFYRPPLLAFQLHSVGPPPALAREGRAPPTPKPVDIPMKTNTRRSFPKSSDLQRNYMDTPEKAWVASSFSILCLVQESLGDTKANYRSCVELCAQLQSN